MISQSLSQKMLQKMSPQQIQLMKLLQIPTFELEQRIKEEIEANPALEEASEPAEEDEYNDAEAPSEEDNGFDFEDYFPEYGEEDQGYRSASDGYTQDDRPAMQIADNVGTLQEFLLRQLNMYPMPDETDRIIARQIIGSIDEDGYLRREASAITDDLLFSMNLDITVKRVTDILKIIQTFDPKGIGARNLQETLIIQVQDKIASENEENSHRLRDLRIAETILCDYFQEFAKKHFSKLAQQLAIEEEDLKSAYEEILKLNPKPAGSFAGGNNQATQYVEPDFIIFNRNGVLEMTVNSRNTPDLRVSQTYKEMVRSLKNKRKLGALSKKEKDTALFVKQKIEAAQVFIESIHKRYDTLHNTMHAIMMKQYDYFLTGDIRYLKPLILKVIAEEIGVDISTVSRVANSKYVQTEFGTKSLKEFFSDKIQNNDGEEVSIREVRNTLARLIESENKTNPLSDEKLVELLSDKGYTLSRRTIAKYRDILNIPVARLRREM